MKTPSASKNNRSEAKKLMKTCGYATGGAVKEDTWTKPSQGTVKMKYGSGGGLGRLEKARDVK